MPPALLARCRCAACTVESGFVLENGECLYASCQDPYSIIVDGECEPCPDTFVANDDDTACVCPPNNVVYEGACTQCPTNNVVYQGACEACPTGSTANADEECVCDSDGTVVLPDGECTSP